MHPKPLEPVLSCAAPLLGIGSERRYLKEGDSFCRMGIKGGSRGACKNNAVTFLPCVVTKHIATALE